MIRLQVAVHTREAKPEKKRQVELLIYFGRHFWKRMKIETKRFAYLIKSAPAETRHKSAPRWSSADEAGNLLIHFTAVK